MTDRDMVRAAAERRADRGYTLDDLHADDPPTVYDTGEVTARVDHVDIRHGVGSMNLNDKDIADALVYPIVQRDKLQLVTETQGHGDEYAVASVTVEPEHAREIAAAIWQAAEDVERLRAAGAGADPADPDAEIDAGGAVGVRFDEEELAAVRDRLPADADARDARDALADAADLDAEYQTEDGRDAIAAVLAAEPADADE